MVKAKRNALSGNGNPVVVALGLLDLYEPLSAYDESRMEEIHKILAEPADMIFEDEDSLARLAESKLREKEITLFIKKIQEIRNWPQRRQYAIRFIAALNVMFPDETQGLGTMFTERQQKQLQKMATPVPKKK